MVFQGGGFNKTMFWPAPTYLEDWRRLLADYEQDGRVLQTVEEMRELLDQIQRHIQTDIPPDHAFDQNLRQATDEICAASVILAGVKWKELAAADQSRVSRHIFSALRILLQATEPAGNE